MGLKKYLPFENYILMSNLSVQEIERRLRENIEPKRTTILSILNTKPTKPYEGYLINNIFKINRIISYRNSFIPLITGDFSYQWGQTRIRIKMRLAPVVLVFMSLWLGIVGLVCLGIIWAAFFRFQEILQSGFSLFLLVPFIMFTFGVLIIIFPFKAESKKSKAFLATLFEGQESEDVNQKL